jgi:hypothetical protein
VPELGPVEFMASLDTTIRNIVKNPGPYQEFEGDFKKRAAALEKVVKALHDRVEAHPVIKKFDLPKTLYKFPKGLRGGRSTTRPC